MNATAYTYTYYNTLIISHVMTVVLKLEVYVCACVFACVYDVSLTTHVKMNSYLPVDIVMQLSMILATNNMDLSNKVHRIVMLAKEDGGDIVLAVHFILHGISTVIH